MVDERRVALMKDGRAKLVLPDYESYQSPLKVITQYDNPVEAIAKLDVRTHNSLNTLNGDSPYYHVAQNIFEALITLDGYVPSSSNPFITQDWLANIGTLAAYGEVEHGGEIRLDSGIAINGTYFGGYGFTNAKIILAPAEMETEPTSGVETATITHAWVGGYEGQRFTCTLSPSTSNEFRFVSCFWFAAGE